MILSGKIGYYYLTNRQYGKYAHDDSSDPTGIIT